MTTFLDALGVVALGLFALTVWPPACLLVIALATFLISWRMS